MSAQQAATSFTGKTAWARNLATPVRDFLSAETGGAVVLLAAVAAALIWANSPWSDSYESFWTTKLSITRRQRRDLHRPAPLGQRGPDDVLLPGRRARGEARARHRRAARAPARWRSRWSPRSAGWRCPSRSSSPSTPGARARTAGERRCRPTRPWRSGVLGLLAPRGTRLRLRLLTLAVVDDLVALVVIATVYTEHLSLLPLALAVRLLRAAAGASLRAGRLAEAGAPSSSASRSGWRCSSPASTRWSPGSPSGLVTSAYPPERADLERVTELARSFREQPTPELARSAQRSVASAISANERLQYAPSPVDELRDRAALRAGERGRPHRRRAAQRRRQLPDHARDRLRLRGRQAARRPRRGLAGVAALARSACGAA